MNAPTNPPGAAPDPAADLFPYASDKERELRRRLLKAASLGRGRGDTCLSNDARACFLIASSAASTWAFETGASLAELEEARGAALRLFMAGDALERLAVGEPAEAES